MPRITLIDRWWLRVQGAPDTRKTKAMRAVIYAKAYGASWRMARHIYLQTLHRRLTRP